MGMLVVTARRENSSFQFLRGMIRVKYLGVQLEFIATIFSGARKDKMQATP